MESIENFGKAPAGKQRAVLKAGFACFGKNGFEKASMGEIAAAAGISKASLFHYFGTKKDFYLYIYNFACEEILRCMREDACRATDFFECIHYAAKLKYEVAQRHPGMLDFILNMAREAGGDWLDELKQIRRGEILTELARMYSNVDWGKLRAEVSPQMAMNLTGWIAYGVARDENLRGAPWDELVKEHDRYIALIKPAIYKEEYL